MLKLFISALLTFSVCSADTWYYDAWGNPYKVQDVLYKPYISEKDAEDFATEAYIYGYPLVTMEYTRRVMTNVEEPESMHAPMNQFANAEKYPNANFRDVTAPNADTLYSTAWLDLSKEPYILHLPDEQGRYYLFPMLSGWTDVFTSLGTRTQAKPGDYAIVGPDWHGTVPSKVVATIRSPTDMVWILGRTYSTGTPEDYEAVHKIQKEYTLTPLSAYGSDYTPPKGKEDDTIDIETPVREQVNALDAQAFFSLLAKLLKDNPPGINDKAIVEKMKKFGLEPGKEFDSTKLDPKALKGFNRSPDNGIEKITDLVSKGGSVQNGWHVDMNLGSYGNNYLQRAAVAYAGLGANLPQDAVYPHTAVDDKGELLDGQNSYILHFDKNKLPPVKGFWSLTLYNDQYFFVQNVLNKYTVSPRDNLKYNEDGSLDLLIQRNRPKKEWEANWLPAPNDPFVLFLRLYWPEESVLNGSWTVPAVKKVAAPR